MSVDISAVCPPDSGMNDYSSTPSNRPSWWFGWLVGGLVASGVAAVALYFYVPVLPMVELDVAFRVQPAGTSEPLLVTGKPGSGDFVYVKHLGGNSVAIGYDQWGFGGPLSPPIAIRPGMRQRVLIESPSLAHVRGAGVRAPERLRVSVDGAVVLEAPVQFRLRAKSQAWFAENPLGGSTCGSRFMGDVFWPDGRQFHGRIREAFSVREKIVAWLRFAGWQALASALIGLVAGLFAGWVARTPGADLRQFLTKHRAGPHRWFITAAAPCVIVFSWLITTGTGQLVYADDFGDFYDYQAASLLEGRLDVPESGISGEAFLVGGKYYGYFGVTPALLRLPFVVFDVAWGGLTRPFMLGYFVACLLASYALLRQATRWIQGPDATPTAGGVGLFTLAIGAGSSLLFLASRAYVYHEAILCGVMFALWAVWFAWRWLETPSSPAWAGALVCGLLSVHARPTTGLFALALTGCAAIAVAWKHGVGRRPLAVAALATAAMLTFPAMSYLKFRTFDGAPLRYHVQYIADPTRLVRTEGRNFHLANIPYNFGTYFWRPDFVLRRTFPYFYMTGRNPVKNPGSKIDIAEMTVSMPFAMPALTLLAAAGLVAFFRWPTTRTPLLVLAGGALPLTGALVTAVAVMQRYTADFCPPLIAAAACGLAAVEAASPAWRRTLRFALAAATLCSILVTLAITLHYQNEIVWGLPDAVKQNYFQLRRTMDALFGFAPR